MAEGVGPSFLKMYMYGHYAFGEMLHSMAYFENIYADMMFIRDCGAKGLFLNADVTAFCLGNLRFRLMSEIIWHPDMTEEEYNERRDCILKEEYGEGWSWVLDFIEIWESTEVGCWNCWGFSSLISTGEFDIEEYSRRAVKCIRILERAYASFANRRKRQKPWASIWRRFCTASAIPPISRRTTPVTKKCWLILTGGIRRRTISL